MPAPLAERPDAADPRRRLPAIHRLLTEPPLPGLVAALGRSVVTGAAREELDARRGARESEALSLADLAAAVARRARAMDRPSLRRVVNATGVVLHTNLGRAPLSEAAIAAVTMAARGYSNLELDLATGERGSRHVHAEGLLGRLCGAEAAMVVNNNAAAVLLALAAVAAGREVVISRGELVEIGGSFRVPDVMAQSGARLREVGTTNRTHAADYREAIGPETAALLRVHPSNYRVLGFTAAVATQELADMAHAAGLPLLYDLGSGTLVELGGEPTVAAALGAGADLVTFSGDKLLGGPQAGVICGRRELVDRCRRHPLTRALRPGKMTLAALQATLRAYGEPGRARVEVPALAMLGRTRDELAAAAEALAAAIRARCPGRVGVEVGDDVSRAGGGALPLLDLATRVVRVRVTPAPGDGAAGAVAPPKEGSDAGLAATEAAPAAAGCGEPGHGGEAAPPSAQAACAGSPAAPLSARDLAAALRAGDPPVVARVQDDAVVLDPRTLRAGESAEVVAALAVALGAARN